LVDLVNIVNKELRKFWA